MSPQPADFIAARSAYHAAHDALVTATLDGAASDDLACLSAARDRAHAAFVNVAARYRMSAV